MLGSKTGFAYDAAGNMLSKVQNGVKTQYTYNAANQIISDGEDKYTYDKNGNLIQKGNTRYTYNALNLLESWTDGESTETYSYNAEGLLSRVTNNEGTTSLTCYILMGKDVTANDAYYCNASNRIGNIQAYSAALNSPVKKTNDNGSTSQFEDILKGLAVFSGMIILQYAEKALDKAGDHTISIGGEYSGAFGVAATYSYGVAIDTNGNIGIFSSPSAGGGIPNIGASGFITVTNAPNIHYLGGVSQQTGGSIGPVGAELVLFKDNETGTTYSGITVAGGMSAVPVELHGTVANTSIEQDVDLKYYLAMVVNKLAEWRTE